MESRFEAQNICFDLKKLVSWKHSFDKYALEKTKINKTVIPKERLRHLKIGSKIFSYM